MTPQSPQPIFDPNFSAAFPSLWERFVHEEPELFSSAPLEVCAATEAPLVYQGFPAIQIDASHLPPFTSLTDQFQALGVIFENAMTVRPSNPCFPCAADSQLLVGYPRAGQITAKFAWPVRLVQGYITSSHPTFLLAFDHASNMVSQSQLLTSNLAKDNSAAAPHYCLSLTASNISRVTFHAPGGQLTLARFAFSC